MNLANAVRVLRRGGVIAYPTEACFGLGCDPLDRNAVYRILELKRRSVEQGLILIAGRLQHLSPFIDTSDEAVLNRPLQTWPGPYTWIMPATADAPYWITGQHNGIAVRVTAHPLVVKLCDQYGGAIVSTSANPHGQPPARHWMQANCYFGTGVDVYLKAATGGLDNPSTIQDATTGALIRSG